MMISNIAALLIFTILGGDLILDCQATLLGIYVCVLIPIDNLPGVTFLVLHKHVYSYMLI